MPQTRSASSQKSVSPTGLETEELKKSTSKPFKLKRQVAKKRENELIETKLKTENAITDIEDVVPKKSKWEPQNWRRMLEGIRKMREKKDAPVDTMGCHMCADDSADPKLQRFQIMISLMLSAQTKDEVNFAACSRLRNYGFSPAELKDAEESRIGEIIRPVGFYKTKAKNVRKVAQICFERYDSDIPHSVDELCELPGVGPKMAYLAMNCAWKETLGIGVDTHVHRLAQRWKWLPKGVTKSPEDTREQLESWLPNDLWQELNWLLVGFGQTICSAVNPKCSDCLINDVCPSAFKEIIKKKSPKKKRT